MGRTPFTLLLAITKDMWRLLFLTTAVLVTVFSFATCIKPLSDGKLDASDLPMFMLLASVPMLAYALPFAGAFAASLTYYRLATDNELTASQASGVSLKRLLLPSLVTGLILGAALLILNEQVIPRFLRHMERLITADIPKLLAASVERGQPLRIGDTIIYADSVHVVEDLDPSIGATDQLVLGKLVMITVDRNDNVVSEATATSSGIWIYPPELTTDGTNRAFSVLAVKLLNSVATQRSPGSPPTLVQSKSTEVSLSVSNFFKDNPKFATWGELRALRETPEKLNRIDLNRRDLAFWLGQRQLMQALVVTLEKDKSVTLTRDDDNESITLKASGLVETPQGWIARPLTPGSKIDIEILRRGGRDGASVLTRYSAERVVLTPNPREERNERKLKLRLDADNARVNSGNSADSSSAPGIPRYTRSDLTFASNPIEDLLKSPLSRLLTIADSPLTDDPTRKAADDLRKNLVNLFRDITSKQHERLAFAASTFLMVLTGAVTAIRMQRRLPLVVYLWTFFPALACVVTIAGGQQLNRSIGANGLILLWAGVIILAIHTYRSYARIARN